jgi:hypothetical protein
MSARGSMPSINQLKKMQEEQIAQEMWNMNLNK